MKRKTLALVQSLILSLLIDTLGTHIFICVSDHKVDIDNVSGMDFPISLGVR